MWNPVRIEFDNLFAHRHSEYEFKQNECVVIFGRNDDDRGLDNNGAGKTTLFEAICIALTNDSLRNIKKEDFINDSANDCKITFELYNPVLRMSMKIVRQFFRGNKPVKVELWENEKLNTQVVSVNDANKRVLELLGISREDLLRYYIISQDNHYTFFTAGDVEKKEIMNRITSADMINPIIDELKNRFNEVDEQIGDVTEMINECVHKKEALEEQKRELLENDDTDDKIERINRRIASNNDQIKQLKSDEKRYADRIEELDKEIGEFGELPDTASWRESRKKHRENINKLEEQLSENARVQASLEREVAGKVKCPDCGSEFIPNSKLGVTYEQAVELLNESKQEEKTLNAKLEKERKQLESDDKFIKKADEDADKVADLKARKQKGERLLSNLKSEIEGFENTNKRCCAEIQELKDKQKDNTAIKNIDKKIKEYEQTISVKEKESKPLNEKLDMIQFWQFNLGKSGFMTYLANRSIKIIEGVTNSYLRKFGVDISVVINGFKVLKTGEVREKIDVFVTNDGITAKQFMAKSGGERGRVTLAGVLGIQHLINMSTNGRGMNLLLADECFPGMDSLGQENIIKVFEKLGSTMLVITQNVSDSFNNKNTLFVVKENGVSKYIS